MRARVPLLVRILGWFFLNLALLAGALFFFLRTEFRVDALMAGRAGERVQQMADALLGELRVRPRAEWDDLLQRFGESYGIGLALVAPPDEQIAGPRLTLPPEVNPPPAAARTVGGPARVDRAAARFPSGAARTSAAPRGPLSHRSAALCAYHQSPPLLGSLSDRPAGNRHRARPTAATAFLDCRFGHVERGRFVFRLHPVVVGGRGRADFFRVMVAAVCARHHPRRFANDPRDRAHCGRPFRRPGTGAAAR